MAVVLEGTTKRFVGTSADTKPVPVREDSGRVSADVPAGSSFLESDTGDIYRWNGFAWMKGSRETTDETNRLLVALLDKLTDLYDLMDLRLP